jgi:RNA polymerase sigma-B factor
VDRGQGIHGGRFGSGLRAQADRELLLRYQRHGEEAAREELVRRLMPLARRTARRYRRANEPLDDLLQVAVLGLVKAIDRFDPERGTAFSSYAVPTMLGELKRHFRDNGWAVHVPRGVQERVLAVENALAVLGRVSAGAVTVPQIARHCGISEEEVLEALEAATAHDAVSLDAHRFGDEADGSAYADVVGEEDGRYELIEYGATIAPALRALDRRDRLVLHLRFAEDLTQAEIADRIGISQMHVSRLLRRALDRLRVVAERAA